MCSAQCRAARGLLGWSQSDLATFAGLGTSTVADFERGQRVPTRSNLMAMRRTLEAAGVVLISDMHRMGVALQIGGHASEGPESLSD